MARPPKITNCPKCKKKTEEFDQGSDGCLFMCRNENCEMCDEAVAEWSPKDGFQWV